MTDEEIDPLDDFASMVDPSLGKAGGKQQPIEPPSDPWLARRMDTFGASEAGSLLIALGHEHPEVPKYVTDLAKRIFAVKAGIRRPLRAGHAAAKGNDVEPELVRQWNQDPTSGWPPMTWARDALPQELLPLLDRVERRMSWTPDGWCVLNGHMVVGEVKTDIQGQRTEPDWAWKWQVQQAMAVSGAPCALILYGPGWAHWNENRRGKIVPFVVERDEDAIALLRKSAAEGWRRVAEIQRGQEALKGGRDGK